MSHVVDFPYSTSMQGTPRLRWPQQRLSIPSRAAFPQGASSVKGAQTRSARKTVMVMALHPHDSPPDRGQHKIVREAAVLHRQTGSKRHYTFDIVDCVVLVRYQRPITDPLFYINSVNARTGSTIFYIMYWNLHALRFLYVCDSSTYLH